MSLGSMALYDFYSFNVIPALGGAVTGDAQAYRYLVELIRRFPGRETFAQMMREVGFARRLVSAHDGRHCRAAFGLALVITAVSTSRGSARAGFVLAREGVLAFVDTEQAAAAGARGRARRAFDRAARAHHRGEPSGHGINPPRPVLREAWAVPRDASGCGGRGFGTRSRIAAGQDAPFSAGRGSARGRNRAG